jgi:predicted dehydrogenase
VYAFTNLRKPDVYTVDDNAVIACKYDRGAAILEGSWSLSRSFQDVEVFGTEGSLTATRREVVLTPKGRNAQPRTLEAPALPGERSSMVPYLIDCLQNDREPEGMTALDINVDVVEIIEAARQSAATARAVALPLP